VAGQLWPQFLGLGLAGGVQGNIAPALHDAGFIPIGLAMAHEMERDGGDHGSIAANRLFLSAQLDANHGFVKVLSCLGVCIAYPLRELATRPDPIRPGPVARPRPIIDPLILSRIDQLGALKRHKAKVTIMYAQPTLSSRADLRAYTPAPVRSPDATPDTTGDLQCLFKSYDSACLDFDADAVAAFYDLPCLISAPDGTCSFTVRSDLRAAFARVFAGYRCQGLASASLVSLKIEALSASFAQARVIWSLANGRGADVASVGCAYTLRHALGKWRIVHVVTLDETDRRRPLKLNLASQG
jgi:hypothetical protein